MLQNAGDSEKLPLQLDLGGGGNVARTLPSRSYGFWKGTLPLATRASGEREPRNQLLLVIPLGLDNAGKGQRSPVDPFQNRKPSRDQNKAERVNSESGEENRQYSVHVLNVLVHVHVPGSSECSMYKELPF